MTCCMEYQQQSCQEIPNSGTNTAVASTGVLLASAELLAPGGLTGDAIDDGAGPWAVPAKRPRDRERLENLAEIVAAIEAKQRLRDRTSNEAPRPGETREPGGDRGGDRGKAEAQGP